MISQYWRQGSQQAAVCQLLTEARVEVFALALTPLLDELESQVHVGDCDEGRG